MSITVLCPSCRKQLKAPDSAVGKVVKCPGCSLQFTLPEPVHDAEEVDDGSGLEQPSTPAPSGGIGDLLDEADEYRLASAPANAAADSGEERRPCPMCGEMIVASAIKCRFCGEVFDPALKKKKKRYADDDSDLTTGEWVLAILCSGIGCIMGIVWLIQGKSKGAKMIGISIVASIFWGVLRAMIEMAAEGP